MNDDYENPDDDDQEEEDADDEEEEDDNQDEEDAVDDDDDKWQQIWTLNRHGPTWRCDVRSRRRNRTCHRRAGLGIARKPETGC
jgi:hypothetical protein